MTHTENKDEPYLQDFDDMNGGMDEWENTDEYARYMAQTTEAAEEGTVIKS